MQKTEILVVDDDLMTLFSISEILKKIGFQPITAENGKVALEKFKETQFPVVITDLEMPELRGDDLIRAIKKIQPDTIIIMISSTDKSSTVLEIMRMGIFDFLIKPITETEIELKINRAVEAANMIQTQKLLEKLKIEHLDTIEKQEKELEVSYNKLQELYNKMESYLDVAIHTQASLISTKFPESKAFQFSSFYKPYFKIGGDLIAYENYPSEQDHRIDLLFGDISGHGISSALMSGMILLAFKIASSTGLSPGAGLQIINQHIIPLIKDHFFCGIYLKYYVNRGELHYSYAGHQPILCIEGQEAQALEGRGVPLVLIPGATFQDYTFKLKKGNKLLFYSDGMFEVFDSKEQIYGFDRFVQNSSTLKNKSGKECLDEIYQDVHDYCDGNFRDDTTMLLLEILEETKNEI